MGWTFTHISGRIDRRAEVDKELTWRETSETYGEVNVRVLKSTMRGSIYYGAVERTDNAGRTVFGAVALTAVDNRSYYNFGFKMMDETMGPVECRCPKSILDLLTETGNEYAMDWRRRCREEFEKPSKPSLAKLPIGALIRVSAFGKEYEAVKRGPNHQFKTCWFYIPAMNQYISKKHIQNFTVLA